MAHAMTREPRDFAVLDPDKATTPHPPILVLTGEREAGKSSTCLRIAEMARDWGWDVAGVLSPGLFRDGARVGILAADPRSGHSRPLAVRRWNPETGDLCYDFDQEVLAWADGLVASSSPCDLLILDELGPLEIQQDRGIVSALPLLREGRYRLAVVVVRPCLMESFNVKLGLPCTTRTVEKPICGPADSRDVSVSWFEGYLRG